MITLDISPNQQAVFEKASQMAGVNVNEFILNHAFSSALDFLQQNEPQQGIHLTPSEWENAINLLENPPEANDNMKALVKRGYQLANQ